MTNTTTPILVASDDGSDADLVKRLLAPEFSKVATSHLPGKEVEDFERHRPEVLVLAFNTLEKAERYYLGLYRHSSVVHALPHRTVILCNKDDVKRVADLCMRRHFDDYILFWPMNHDAPRLPMSVHLAIRELHAGKGGGPSVAEFAAQARHIAQLEGLLERQLSAGTAHVAAAGKALEHAGMSVETAIDGFARRISEGKYGDLLEVKDVEGLWKEVSRLRAEEIQPHTGSLSTKLAPLNDWRKELQTELGTHLQTARTLGEMANSIKPKIFVVDDDDFQHKLIGKILGSDSYELTFALTGSEAMSTLRNYRPDLILMDVQLPDLNGLEMTKRLKMAPHLSSIPIIMVSGKSESSVVLSCLKAGAADFVVKPYEQETLKAKVARMSRPMGNIRKGGEQRAS